MQGGRPARPPVPIFGAADKPAVPKFTGRVPSPDDEDDYQSLNLAGSSCQIHRDDATAAWLETEQHLQLWMENKAEDLWIDRFDVRQLLSDSSQFAKRKLAPSVADEEEEMLDAERYGDLPPDYTENTDGSTQDHSGDPEHEDVASSAPANQFGAVHFSFGGQQSTQKTTPPEIAAFARGWLTELPYGSALPQTFKQHQVIERTAKFVHKEGKKMEAMLKVKHGGNAAFQFLLVDHPLQSYYQALLKYLGYCPEAADLPTLLPSLEQPQGETVHAVVDATAGAEGKAEITCAVAQDHGSISESSKHEECAEAATSGEKSGGAGDEAGASGTDPVEETSKEQAAEPDDAPTGRIPVPPADMLQTIDKLVRWILKSGRDFEKKVKDRQRGDPRFDFLMPWNPYNAFYRQKLEDAFAGKLDPPVSATSESATVSAPASAPASESEPIETADTCGDGEEDKQQTGEYESGLSEGAVARSDDESNPKVQFITSFGEDSEGGEDEDDAGKNTIVDEACEATAPVPEGTVHEGASIELSAEEEPKKERNSRFGPELSESEKKAARLARARKLAGLVKDKVDLAVSSQAADGPPDSCSKSPLHGRPKSPSRRPSSHSRRSRSPSRKDSRRRGSRERGRSSSPRSGKSSSKRLSPSRERHSRKESKRARSGSRERSGRRSSRSRSRHRDNDRDRRRHDDSRGSRTSAYKRRRSRSRSSARKQSRRKNSSSRSRSRSRSRMSSRTSTNRTSRTPIEKPADEASSAPALLQHHGAHDSGAPHVSGADDGTASASGSVVSDDLRTKVKAMLANM